MSPASLPHDYLVRWAGGSLIGTRTARRATLAAAADLAARLRAAGYDVRIEPVYRKGARP